MITLAPNSFLQNKAHSNVISTELQWFLEALFETTGPSLASMLYFLCFTLIPVSFHWHASENTFVIVG